MLKKTWRGVGGEGAAPFSRRCSDRIGKTRRLQVNALRISHEALVVVYSFLDTRIACIVKANQEIRRDLEKRFVEKRWRGDQQKYSDVSKK